jgi:hypothetical protein
MTFEISISLTPDWHCCDGNVALTIPPPLKVISHLPLATNSESFVHSEADKEDDLVIEISRLDDL